MDFQRLRSLSPRFRALVAIAVLLDGHEAATYLENDAVNGAGLKRSVADLASLPLELRLPFAGTLLRAAVEEL